jgi:light-regulated signal transduction histidine kinase (bacteriophytochrome)
MPHGHCYFWKPEVLWTNVIGDFATALAYFLIPFGLYYFIKKKKEVRYRPLFLLFALFILSCGTTHVLDIISVWHPIYRLEGLLKLFTGAISLITAYVLIKAIPDALNIPSQKTLRLLNEELQQRNNSLQRIGYATSHNMKEPVRGLAIYAQKIKTKYGDLLPQEAIDDLNYMQDEGGRMLKIVESLMDYSNITKENFEFQNVSLEKIIFDVKKALRVKLEESKASINLGTLPNVYGNENLLTLLFQKIINNSIRFQKANSNLVIEISSAIASNRVLIIFKDNSIGFSSEYKKKVLNLFTTLSNTDTNRSSGMGLAISRRIAELHGGKLEIDSEEGKGVCIKFSLPLAKQ